MAPSANGASAAAGNSTESPIGPASNKPVSLEQYFSDISSDNPSPSQPLPAIFKPIKLATVEASQQSGCCLPAGSVASQNMSEPLTHVFSPTGGDISHGMNSNPLPDTPPSQSHTPRPDANQSSASTSLYKPAGREDSTSQGTPKYLSRPAYSHAMEPKLPKKPVLKPSEVISSLPQAQKNTTKKGTIKPAIVPKSCTVYICIDSGESSADEESEREETEVVVLQTSEQPTTELVELNDEVEKHSMPI